MRTVLRAFLPALALLSMLVFSTPAAAGMVSTPLPAGGEDPGREAALALLKARLADIGPVTPEVEACLAGLSPEERAVFASSIEATVHAGHDHYGRLILWTIGILVVLWWLAFDRERYHRHCH